MLPASSPSTCPNKIVKFVPLVGRILYSAVFIAFGMNHLTTGAGMAAYVPGFVPFPVLVVYLTGILIVVCGLMIAAGYRTRIAALILALFVLSTALFVHGGGFIAGDQASTTNFMKDIGLTGAGLLIYHFGAGPMSMDASTGLNGNDADVD
jgi:uncharacterized membrane protein YphA (DoxX/SURF4 family)